MSPTHGLALRREDSPPRRVGATAPAPGGGRGLPGPLARASWRHRPAPGPTRGPERPRVPVGSATVLWGDPAHSPRGLPGRARDGGRCEDPAPGPTRGRDPRSAAATPPPEVPDQVRDGGRSWQDPLPGRGVRNVETRSTTCPETHKPESPRP